MQQSSIQLILVDPNYRVSTAFKERFDYLLNVKIVNSDFEKLTNYDCLVSPANSGGMMDGRVDAAITKFFGVSVMERVQQYLLTKSKIIHSRLKK